MAAAVALHPQAALAERTFCRSVGLIVLSAIPQSVLAGGGRVEPSLHSRVRDVFDDLVD